MATEEVREVTEDLIRRLMKRWGFNVMAARVCTVFLDMCVKEMIKKEYVVESGIRAAMGDSSDDCPNWGLNHEFRSRCEAFADHGEQVPFWRPAMNGLKHIIVVEFAIEMLRAQRHMYWGDAFGGMPSFLRDRHDDDRSVSWFPWRPFGGQIEMVGSSPKTPLRKIEEAIELRRQINGFQTRR